MYLIDRVYDIHVHGSKVNSFYTTIRFELCFGSVSAPFPFFLLRFRLVFVPFPFGFRFVSGSVSYRFCVVLVLIPPRLRLVSASIPARLRLEPASFPCRSRALFRDMFCPLFLTIFDLCSVVCSELCSFPCSALCSVLCFDFCSALCSELCSGLCSELCSKLCSGPCSVPSFEFRSVLCFEHFSSTFPDPVPRSLVFPSSVPRTVPRNVPALVWVQIYPLDVSRGMLLIFNTERYIWHVPAHLLIGTLSKTHGLNVFGIPRRTSSLALL